MVQVYPNKYLLGITGNIGAGKSTVLSLFQELGAKTISSDALAKKYTEPNSPVKEELKQIFGESIFNESGEILRGKLAELAFSDDSKRNALNYLLHPRVRKDFLEEFHKPNTAKVVAWEVPLLFETDAHTICSGTLTVFVDPAKAWERVQTRGGMTKEDFERRTKSQLPIEEKKALSDFAVSNDTNREELRNHISNIYKTILAKVDT